MANRIVQLNETDYDELKEKASLMILKSKNWLRNTIRNVVFANLLLLNK